jgi:outer membrane protein insertion porin family
MRLAAALVLACALVVPAAAAPVDELFGRRIVSVTVAIEGVATTDRALVDLIETHVEAPLEAEDVRESIAHLFGLGRYEDVRVYADPSGDGAAVRYDLIPAHVVGEIEFTGELGLSESVLRRAVSERFGVAPSPARVAEVEKLLRGLYEEHGYLQATIGSSTRVEHAPERTSLMFTIQAGPRATIRRVIMEGNAPESLEVARRLIGVQPGQPYDRQQVASRIAEYVGSLRRTGYYEATGDHALHPLPDRLAGDVVITLDGGPHVTVSFKGDPLPEGRRDELVPIAREGSVDEDLLEDSARRIAEALRSEGYRDAEVTYTRMPSDGELAVVFTVRRGPAYRVRGVEVTGNASVPLETIQPLLQVHAGEPLRDEAVDADVARIVDLYRRRGFADVKVESAVVPAGDTRPVDATVRLAIAEGPRIAIGSIEIEGERAISDAELREGLQVKPGQAFYQPQLATDRDGIVLKYLNRGFRSAEVDVRVHLSPDRTRADVHYVVHEGAQVFVDHVLIVGNEKTSAETVRREIAVKPGDPLGYEAMAETQRRVSALGLFRRVRVTEADHGVPGRRDVIVTIEEAPATTIGYGGGVEVGRRLVRTSADAVPSERFEFAPRGFFEIGRRNLFGRNRSVNLFTRISLRLRNDPVITNDGEQPATDFNEYRVLGTYRQPRFLLGADFLATGFLEQGARTSFDFNRRGVRAELARRVTPTLSVSGRYSLERTEVFNETFAPEDQLLIDRLFPQVRLSTVSSSLIRDTRDDPLNPSHGALVGIDAEIAGRAIGSEVGFIKSFTQGFVYRRLPGKRGVVFATGARLGLAAGFAQDVKNIDVEDIQVDQLPASERFFAGGDTTVRGWALDQLGTPATLDANGFPKGGNAVLVMNAELRVPVWGDLGAVAFVDAGNVWARVPDFAFGDVRGAVGFGLRYRSPIGPLRVDLGFKLDRRPLPNGSDERLTALHISLGQAF